MGLGWKGWTRERLPADQLQGYLQDQVVQAYASAAARTASGPAAPVEGMVSWLADVRRMDVYSSGAWRPVLAASTGRVPFHTGSIAVDAAITGVITLDALPWSTRVTFTAMGRTGFGAAIRTIGWDWDSLPAAGGVTVDEDDPATRITVASAQWATAVFTVHMDLPAGVAPTARLVYRADGAGYARGAVVWHRTRI